MKIKEWIVDKLRKKKIKEVLDEITDEETAVKRIKSLLEAYSCVTDAFEKVIQRKAKRISGDEPQGRQSLNSSTSNKPSGIMYGGKK